MYSFSPLPFLPLIRCHFLAARWGGSLQFAAPVPNSGEFFSVEIMRASWKEGTLHLGGLGSGDISQGESTLAPFQVTASPANPEHICKCQAKGAHAQMVSV